METFSRDITTIGAALGIHADNPALERTYCVELGVLIREQKSLLDINRNSRKNKCYPLYSIHSQELYEVLLVCTSFQHSQQPNEVGIIMYSL